MHLYVQEVLAPYYKAQKVRLGMPLDYPCVWIIDCWSVHIKDAFIAWVRQQYPFIRIVFIPANCTGLMQPCDLVGQRDLKCILRAIATLFAMVQLRVALKRLEGLSRGGAAAVDRGGRAQARHGHLDHQAPLPGLAPRGAEGVAGAGRAA